MVEELEEEADALEPDGGAKRSMSKGEQSGEGGSHRCGGRFGGHGGRAGARFW